MTKQSKNWLHYFTLVSLILFGVTSIGLQNTLWGVFFGLISTLSLFFTDKTFTKDIALIIPCLALLGVSEISTDISNFHILTFGTILTAVVIVPYLISKKVYKKDNIKFNWGRFRENLNIKLFYILFTAVIAYLLLPVYLTSTGAYLNWPSDNDPASLIRLFIGTNGLGIWDELFFVVIIFNLLKSHFSLKVANLAQAILWTAFLYELGFIGWGVIAIFIFALSQGYIFYKTHSLPYTIAIHLTLDFILYLALVNAHHPSYFNIFIN